MSSVVLEQVSTNFTLEKAQKLEIFEFETRKNLSFMVQFSSQVEFRVLGSNSKKLEYKILKKFEFIRVPLFRFELCMCLLSSCVLCTLAGCPHCGD